MTKTFPRLLIATEFPPNASGGGPAIVRKMLKDWPVEKLFWWSCLPERGQLFGQQVASHRVARIPPKLYPYRRWRTPKVWALENLWTPWAAGHFRRTLAELKPEAVWVIPHCWSISPLARVLPSGKFGFHVSVHDFADCGCWVSQFGQTGSRHLAEGQDKLYLTATTKDAISHPMIADLRARLGAKGELMVHSGLEREDFEYLEHRVVNPSDRIRIVYAGSISVEPSFMLFVKALAAIRDRFPKPVSIEIFSSHSYSDRAWFDGSWMHERGNLPEPEFTHALRECDWGFAPMSLANDDPRHLFSLPTKFISYLTAGLSVFSLGHPESSVVKMTEMYRVGACVASSDLERLKSKMLEVFSLPEPWKVFGPEILRCARNEFDAAQTRETLYQCFRECARKTKT